MTTQTIEASKEKLISEFNAVVAETEHLLKSVASAGGEKAGALRTSVEQSLASARERLIELQHAASAQTKAAAQATDEYVHIHPWQAIGITAGVSALIGAVIGLSFSRR